MHTDQIILFILILTFDAISIIDCKMALQVLNSCLQVVNQSRDVKIIRHHIPKLAEKVIAPNLLAFEHCIQL